MKSYFYILSFIFIFQISSVLLEQHIFLTLFDSLVTLHSAKRHAYK